MPAEKMTVVNYGAFGEKVKAWAKGIDPLPTSVEELRSQLDVAHVGATIPDGITRIAFVQSDEQTLYLRLPCKALLEQSEQRLSQPGEDYALPQVYERVFQKRPTIDDKMKFHAERIGDYTVASCA